MATDAPSGERTVFFDLETAGLKTDSSIIQIGAVAVDSAHRELETFEAKIRFHPHGASAKVIQELVATGTREELMALIDKNRLTCVPT